MTITPEKEPEEKKRTRMTKRIRCECVSVFQDKKFKGKRIANACFKAGTLIGYRCSVCGTVKTV